MSLASLACWVGDTIRTHLADLPEDLLTELCAHALPFSSSV